MSLVTDLQVKIRAEQARSLDLVAPSGVHELISRCQMASGTSTGQADRCWSDERTIAASSNEDLDLAGSLTDEFGQTFTLAKIKALIIKADSGNTNNLQITRPASNGVPMFLAAGDGLVLPPDGILVWTAPKGGVTVTAGTGDLLNIANGGSGTGVTYKVIVIGTSA